MKVRNNTFMRINEQESLEEKLYRHDLIFKEERRVMPYLIALAIIAILVALFVGYNRQLAQYEAYGPGNPYVCETCKSLQRACKEHRNFDAEAALNEKIAKFIDRYNPNGSDEDSRFAIYGYGNSYNTNCDFCNDANECYSCSYDRLYLKKYVDEITVTNEFYSRLCDNCYKELKANCSLCKEMLASMIIDTMH